MPRCQVLDPNIVGMPPGAYLGFCQGGCTFLDPDPHQDFELDPDPHQVCFPSFNLSKGRQILEIFSFFTLFKQRKIVFCSTNVTTKDKS
jgi:hypothetical protein